MTKTKDAHISPKSPTTVLVRAPDTALEAEFDRSNDPELATVGAGDGAPVSQNVAAIDISDDKKIELVAWLREKITISHQHTYRQVIETARLCFRAREQLGYKTDFEKRLVSSLPFGPSVYSMYSRIGRYADTMLKLEGQLPPHYSTLYLIANADGQHLKELLAERRVTPSSTREHVRQLKKLSLIHAGREELANYEEEKAKRKGAQQERSEWSKRHLYATLAFTDTPPEPKECVVLEGILGRLARKYSLKISVLHSLAGKGVTLAALADNPDLVKEAYKEIVPPGEKKKGVKHSKEMTLA